ncbi:predicted protein [Histoplasma mississippiense (nom. inval.)]|nr:predicted protein [Histoplasma mississippiense (nom. inval.)]EDN02829.1 predicted protein [Histoplasma mississippiense (nom. inval.)]
MQLCEINQVENISGLYVVKMILIRACKEPPEAFRVYLCISSLSFPDPIPFLHVSSSYYFTSTLLYMDGYQRVPIMVFFGYSRGRFIRNEVHELG